MAVDKSTAVATSSSNDLLESIVPVLLILAAATCWIDPTKSASVFFIFCGLAFIYRDPVIESLTKPFSHHISESATKTAEEIFGNETRFDRILTVGTDAFQRAMESEPLRKSLKLAIVEATQDDDLLHAVLSTTTSAIVKASRDENLRAALVVVAKEGVLEALRDEFFMKDIVASLVAAIVSASRDEELKGTVVSVSTEAVSAALQEKGFIASLRQVIKDCLGDKEMYRASALGLLGAVIPGGGSSRK